MNPFAVIAGLVVAWRILRSTASSYAMPGPATPTGQGAVPTVSVAPVAAAVALPWRREPNPGFPYQSATRWLWPDGIPPSGLFDAGDTFTDATGKRHDAPAGYTWVMPSASFAKSKAGGIDPLAGLRAFPAIVGAAAQEGLADVLGAVEQLPKVAAMAGEAATVVAGPISNFAVAQGWLTPAQVAHVGSTATQYANKGLAALGALAGKK